MQSQATKPLSVEERIISILLTKSDGTQLPYQYSEDDNNIVIESATPEISNRLKAMLRSAEDLVTFLPLNVQESSAKNKPIEPRIISPDITGVEIIQHMVPPEVMLVSSEWEEVPGEKKLKAVHQLHSKGTLPIRFIAMRRAEMEYIKEYMGTLDIEELRDKLANKSSSQKSSEEKVTNDESDSVQKPGTFAAIMDQVFTFEHNTKERQLITTFNYGLIYQFLVRPRVTTVLLEDTDIPTLNKYRVSLSKEHLSKFFSMINHGVMMEPVYEEDASGHRAITKAHPVINRGVIGGMAKPNYYIIMQDCSESMRGLFDQFSKHKEAMLKYLAEIRKVTPTAKLMVVPFSTIVLEVYEGDISDEKGIEAYSKSLCAEGNTNLFGAYIDVFEKIKNLLNEYNVTLLTFSDGQDNIDIYGGRRRKTKELIAQFEKQKAPINTFFIAMGQYAQADDTTKQMLRDILGEIIETPDAVSLQKLSQYIKSVSRPIELVDIITEITNQLIQGKSEKKSFAKERVAVHAGMPVIAKTTVSVPGEFKIDDQYFTVKNNPSPKDIVDKEWVFVDNKPKSDSKHSSVDTSSIVTTQSSVVLFPPPRDPVVSPSPANASSVPSARPSISGGFSTS